MRRWTGIFATAILCGGMLFGASGQINLNASSMNLNSGSNINFMANGGINLNSRSGTGIMAHSMSLYSFSTLSLNATNNISIEAPSLTVVGGILQSNEAIMLGPLSVTGSKNFIHPHPTDDSRAIRYVAIESGEALTVARGTARTENGRATITLPEHFSIVTSDNAPITVLLTPNGAPVLLYTTHVSRERITVAMRNSDFSEFRDVEFSYQITGVRDGFENQEVIVGVDELFDRNARTSTRQTDGQRRIEAFEERLRSISMERIEEFIRANETENSERGLTDEN